MAGVIERNNVHVRGERRAGDDFRPRLRLRSEHVALRGAGLRGRFQAVLFDHVGAGGSDLSAYDQAKYATPGRLCGRRGGDRARTRPARTPSSSATRSAP